MGAPLNLFFKNLIKSTLFFLIFVFFILVMGIPNARAVVIYGLHLSSCERELGVILHVEPLEISFLTLDGILKKIKRYEIINVSYYNSTFLPLASTAQVEDIPSYIVKTRRGNEITKLLQGWPVEFTNDKISFISSDGSDILINRDNIWDIAEVDFDSKIEKSKTPNNTFQFYPPYQFKECNFSETYPNGKSARVIVLYPQQTLSEPITIKKEFDRLYQGYDTIHQYVREKQFYGVPQVYSNVATLGLWLNRGGRYGTSSSRTSNLLPFIVNEKSAGPYSYQHQMVTGVAPMSKSTHEEPQSQFTYQFKASYFHLMTMIDPNIILVGANYSWKPVDFAKNDIKINDTFGFEFGFDYDAFAIGLRSQTLNYGALYDDYFTKNITGLSSTSLSYHNHLFRLEFANGASPTEEEQFDVLKNSVKSRITTYFDLRFSRLNLDLTIFDKWQYSYSLIQKNSKLGSYISSDSSTHAVYLNYKYGPRYLLGGFLAIESQKIKTQNTTSDSRLFPKFGASFSLKF
jgi:hypothetical protein